MDEEKAMVCNIGDSRVYLFRDGELSQLSVDHTVVQQMIEMNVITKEQARVHRKRHILTQNIGIFREELLIEPSFSTVIDIKKNDIFLLCSDGLTDMLSDWDILEILKKKSNIYQYTQKLVQQALEKGGRDNVTVMLVRALS